MITKQEKQDLMDAGYSRQDINQIIAAEKQTSYYLVQAGNRLTITKDEAIERLGRDEWLRGLAKSTFFVDTVRNGLNGERIALHSKVYA